MPLLNVDDAFDADFLDDITVVRRIQSIDAHGRTVTTETTFASQAVIVATSPDDLQRLPEAQYMNKAISVYSQIPLYGPAQLNYAPDKIIWHGSHFTVTLIDDYTSYGSGFIHAVAVSMEAVDTPPTPPVV